MVARAVAPDMIAAPNVRVVRSGAPVRKGTTRHRESEADLIATTNVDRKHHTNQPRRKLFALRRVSQHSNISFKKVKQFSISKILLPVAAAPDMTTSHDEVNKEGRSINKLGVPFVNLPHLSLEEPQIDQKFRDVLQFIADRSDVELKTPAHMLNDKVHLRNSLPKKRSLCR